MIGDGIGTDLAAARAVGARCVLMLTGVTTRAQVDALPADEQPTAVAADAAELAAALERCERLGRGADVRELRPALAPRGEGGPHGRQGRLVGEGDVERVAVDRPQLGHGQPDLPRPRSRTPRRA